MIGFWTREALDLAPLVWRTVVKLAICLAVGWVIALIVSVICATWWPTYPSMPFNVLAVLCVGDLAINIWIWIGKWWK